MSDSSNSDTSFKVLLMVIYATGTGLLGAGVFIEFGIGYALIFMGVILLLIFCLALLGIAIEEKE